MSFKLVILTTARSPQLLYGSTLVFKTLRVGFPKATVEVWDNASHPECAPILARHAYEVGASFMQIQRTAHHQWIRSILKRETGTVVFCDPDCVFFDSMEDLELKSMLTGRLCPAYFNEVVGCNEVERLHTCLLYVSAARTFREELAEIPVSERFPADMISPRQTARKGKRWFHDTMAMAFGLIGGKAFTADYLARFGHLHCGSMIDLVAHKMTEGKSLMELHRRATLDNEALRDHWAIEDRYYASHPPL